VARIAVVSSHPPFSEGGHLVIARALSAALREAGHETDLVLTPQNRFGRQGAAYLATWLTDVGESEGRRIDQVISLRYPAYAVRHSCHVCWLNHTMREYYDLWPTLRARISPANRLKEGVRRAVIRAADRRLLGPSRLARLYAQSRTIQARLRDDLGLTAPVVYPPPPPRPYRCDAYGEFVLAVSRVTAHKRLDLLVRALAEADGRGLRAVIAGDGDGRDALAALARELGVETRLDLVGRVDDATLVRYYATCRAVCFPPAAEDYGFVTAEALASAKPVVTCRDSGGAAELIEDGRTGFVCEPTPVSLAAALRRLADDRSLAERLGTAGAAAVADLTWPAAVARLLVV
jgi:glycosyltransferase involved in cell wall biosynthesis